MYDQKNPEAYNPGLANACNNLGELYAENGKLQEAEALLSEALTIFTLLAQKDKELCLDYLALTELNLALVYQKHKKILTSMRYFWKGLGHTIAVFVNPLKNR